MTLVRLASPAIPKRVARVLPCALLALCWCATAALAADAPATKPRNDAFKFAGLAPEQAAREITLPPGFRATLFAGEPAVANPIAFTIDARGRLWVVQGMTYPRRAPDGQGKDTVLVFDDTDGDGTFDKRTVFVEGLNLVSGIEVGFGGVWIGAAPYLLFIPTDETADEPKPTAPTRTLLDGWGLQDTHETLNTFCWGPDGWLYGCHGVFTDSRVGKPGAPADQRVHINAGVWRYHPTRHVFERFAEGTSNPWGVDFDDNGQCFIEACVIPHLFHMIQNARYHRQGGRHDNPYTFDDIKTVADHVHWAGAAGPHAGNGKSDSAGGGHAHAGLMCYLGGAFPDAYRGKLFMNNIHGARINVDAPEPRGSGVVGRHAEDFAFFNDRASQIVNLRYDHDGSVYMIDWYDSNQCHSNDPRAHDRTTGRVFKVAYGDAKATRVDFTKMTDAQLVALQSSKAEGALRTARRVLQERAALGKLDPATLKPLADKLAAAGAPAAEQLRALWALHAVGRSAEAATAALASDQPHVAGWGVQLLCESATPSDAALRQFARLAREGPSPVLRLYLASAVLRLPADKRADLLAGLLAHPDDATDHNLPLMYWYGLESIAAIDPGGMIALALETRVPRLLAFAVRRLASGDDDSLAALAARLARTDDAARQVEVLRGLADALKGRRSVKMPAGWADAVARLSANPDPEARNLTRALSVTFGDTAAIESTRAVLADAKASADARRAALDTLLDVKAPNLAPQLQQLLGDAALRAPALRGLAAYDDPRTPRAVLGAYPGLTPAERKDALATLAARAPFAKELLAAVAANTLPARDLSADIVRQLRALNDAEVDREVARVWGQVRTSPAETLNRIEEIKRLLAVAGPTPDLSRGRLVFSRNCQQCHTLFDEGGKLGPDITGSNRADVAYLLENMVDPNAVIPNEYRAVVIDTKDDRTIIGIVQRQDDRTLDVLTANETLTLSRKEIRTMEPSRLSVMPEGVLDALPPAEVRDLIAYLRSPKQVPMAPAPPTTQPVATPK